MGFGKNLFSRKKGDEWLDWLSDERPSADIRSRMQTNAPRVHGPATSSHSDDARRERLRRAGSGVGAQSRDVQQANKRSGAHGTRVFEIRLTMPKLRLPTALRVPKVRVTRQQLRYWSVFGALVIGLSLGARGGIELITGSHATTDGGTKDVKGANVSNKPTFTPAFPKDKKASIEAGKYTYDPKRQLYSFEDEFLKSTLTVSQQPLPSNFKSNPSLLADIAKSIGATDKIDTAYGPAYVATSENKTSQRLVTAHQDLLIFVETIKVYDKESWKAYLEALR